MKNIIYILKRLKNMDKRAMLEKINSIHKKTNKSKLDILIDMQKCATKYGAGYMDYDLFEMYNLTDEQRATYLTRGRNNELVTKYCDLDALHYFQNKDEFNTIFKNYIKRDWIKVNNTPKEKIIDFLKRHSEFMAKPIDGGCGKGIEKLQTSNFKTLDETYEYLTKEGNNFELEEVIKQHPDVAKIYPNAINTVRIVTIVTTKDGKSILTIPKEERKNIELEPHIICAYFRIGNGGRCVDNFNSGGMTAPVDENTGIVSQLAIDKQKNVYEKHPQTGEQIKGFKFPYWEEAINLCKNACKEIPEMGYVGWDVAFTPDGPLFVEGNEFPGHDIYQLPVHTPQKIGMMPKFNFYK
ncbi:MAG: sugar-transfer associated ATP-grasp domain-containing protein [Clostridia bacterium]